MKILYILQQSIYTPDGKWLTADSNINMLVGFLTAFRGVESAWKDTQVDVVIGRRVDFADLDQFLNIFSDPHVNFIQFPFIVDAYYNRQHFDLREWLPIIKNGDYDIIINCLTEQSRNIKTILVREKLKAKLITQCFWLDCPEIDKAKVDPSISYQWRQFDGMECSDLAVFTCQTTFNDFFQNAPFVFDAQKVREVFQKSTIWDFGYSQFEVDMYKRSRIVPQKCATIGFLNRLAGINYTNHTAFIEAIKLLAADPQYKDRFAVRFTNPSKKVDDDWLASNVPNFESFLDGKPLNRAEYFQFLNECDITCHLFVIEAYGGCALRESIACGNVPVVAWTGEQSVIVDNPRLMVPITVNNEVMPDDIATSLKWAIDFVTGEMMQDGMLDMLTDLRGIRALNYEMCAFETQIQRFLSDIGGLYV